MKRLALALLSWLLILPAAASGADPSQVDPTHRASAFRHASADAAWQAVQKSKRPLLLFISSADCRFCTKMARDTYSHPQIAAALAESCEAAAVLREENPELIKKLQVRAFPTTVIVAPDGKELARVEGYQSPARFAELMFGPPERRNATVRPASATGPAR